MGPKSSLQLSEGQIEVIDGGAKFFLVLVDGKTRKSGHSRDLGGTGGPSLGGCCSPGVDWGGACPSLEAFKAWPDKAMADLL